MALNIIARKPRQPADFASSTAEVVLIDRGGVGSHHRYVTGIVNDDSLRNNEWWWGHYHDTLTSAMKDFEARV